MRPVISISWMAHADHDMFDGTAWRTILVGGLNAGGRGYYALDVTNPSSPKALWEICSDSTLCGVSIPIWVTRTAIRLSPSAPLTASGGIGHSGYNNVSPGTGYGYLYVLDALTGAVLNKVDTHAVDSAAGSTTPQRLAKISAWANSANQDNTALRAYGGDLLGNVWRFDLSTNPATVMKLATLEDASGNPQSVTTRPELGLVESKPVVYVGTGRYLGQATWWIRLR